MPSPHNEPHPLLWGPGWLSKVHQGLRSLFLLILYRVWYSQVYPYSVDEYSTSLQHRAYHCSLRCELLGLKWKHIEIDDGVGTIDVRQSLTYVKDVGNKILDPKTKNSKRKVSIPPSLIPEVMALKVQSAKTRMQSEELWEEGERLFVFSSMNGKPLYP